MQYCMISQYWMLNQANAFFLNYIIQKLKRICYVQSKIEGKNNYSDISLVFLLQQNTL